MQRPPHLFGERRKRINRGRVIDQAEDAISGDGGLGVVGQHARDATETRGHHCGCEEDFEHVVQVCLALVDQVATEPARDETRWISAQNKGDKLLPERESVGEDSAGEAEAIADARGVRAARAVAAQTIDDLAKLIDAHLLARIRSDCNNAQSQEQSREKRETHQCECS